MIYYGLRDLEKTKDDSKDIEKILEDLKNETDKIDFFSSENSKEKDIKIFKFYISDKKNEKSDLEFYNETEEINEILNDLSIYHVRLYFDEKIKLFKDQFKWFYLIIFNSFRRNITFKISIDSIINSLFVMDYILRNLAYLEFEDAFNLIKIYSILSIFSCDEIQAVDELTEDNVDFNPWDHFNNLDLSKEKLPLMGVYSSERTDKLGCRKILICKKNIEEVYKKLKDLYYELNEDYFSIDMLKSLVLIHEFGHCAFDNNYFKKLKIDSKKKERQANFFASYMTKCIFDRLILLLSLIQSKKYKNPLLLSSIFNIGYDQFFDIFWDLFEE